jgi:hypothetical protein
VTISAPPESVGPGSPAKRRKKSGRRRLVAGQPRLLGRHHGAAGAAFRRHWFALVAEYGQPARGSLIAMEMGRVCVALVRVEAAEHAWLVAQEQRARSKGRRATSATVARLQKRASIEQAGVTAMLDRLRTLVPRPGDADTFASRVRGNGHASG